MISVSAAPDHFFLQLALGALGLILGWVIVHKLSSDRDLNRERRSLISAQAAAYIQIVNKLLVDARKYHTSARSEEAEQTIKMAIQDLAEGVSALRGLLHDESLARMAQSAVKALRMAITGKHFEDEHVAPLSDPDAILEDMAAASLRAKRALLNLQHAPYRQLSPRPEKIP